MFSRMGILSNYIFISDYLFWEKKTLLLIRIIRSITKKEIVLDINRI